MSRQIIDLIDLIEFMQLGTAKKLVSKLRASGIRVERADSERAGNAMFNIDKAGNPFIQVPTRANKGVSMETLAHEIGHSEDYIAKGPTYKRFRTVLRKPPEQLQMAKKTMTIGYGRAMNLPDHTQREGQLALRRINRSLLEKTRVVQSERAANKYAKTWLKENGTERDVRDYASSLAPSASRYRKQWHPALRRAKSEIEKLRTQQLSSPSPLIQFERVANPIYRKGVKPGIHRIGEGKEKMIRIRSIVSPQWGIDKGKVSKMVRKKNLPPPVVSHLGHGVYVLKDGNHRVNAILRQGKRKILAKVQKL